MIVRRRYSWTNARRPSAKVVPTPVKTALPDDVPLNSKVKKNRRSSLPSLRLEEKPSVLQKRSKDSRSAWESAVAVVTAAPQKQQEEEEVGGPAPPPKKRQTSVHSSTDLDRQGSSSASSPLMSSNGYLIISSGSKSSSSKSSKSSSRRKSKSMFKYPATLAKSKNHRTKQVTWSPTEKSIHQDMVDPYEDLPKEQLWYSPDELREISNDTTKNHDGRGSDESSWTDDRAWERYQHHRDCLNTVLDEQDRQWGIDKEYCQNTAKRIKHLPFDHYWLACLSRDATANARRVALLRGKRDILETQALSWRKQKDQDTVQTKVCSDVDCKDQDTVQTEVCSDVDSDASSEITVQEEQQVPRFVCCLKNKLTILQEKDRLQQKHQERYARYLDNRKKRLAARERADYQWEQRRLARAASIRREADLSIEKLHRIMNRSRELCDLIMAKSSS